MYVILYSGVNVKIQFSSACESCHTDVWRPGGLTPPMHSVCSKRGGRLEEKGVWVRSLLTDIFTHIRSCVSGG
jgi:hypothetical protein